MGVKELSLIKIAIKNAFAYKIDYLFRFTYIPIFIVVQIALWSTLLSGGSIQDYTLAGMISYFIIATISRDMTSTWSLPSNISRDVVSGDIVNTLLRPINYIKYNLLNTLSQSFVSFATLIPTIVIINFFYPLNFNIGLSLLLFIVFIALGFVMNFFLESTLGYISFWVESNWGILHSVSFISFFFSGALIPVDLLTPRLRMISEFLPFRYLVYIPTKILQNEYTMDQVLTLGGVSLIWIVVLYFLSKIVFHMGIKKVSGHGV